MRIMYIMQGNTYFSATLKWRMYCKMKLKDSEISHLMDFDSKVRHLIDHLHSICPPKQFTNYNTENNVIT